MRRVQSLSPLVLVSALLVGLISCGANGRPEIIEATIAQDTERIRELIAEGADVNDRGNGDWIPAIHYTQGNEEILRVLLEAGADPNIPDPTSTVLGSYALAGKVSAVTLLLEHGAEIDAQDPLYGKTALHNAASNGHLEIVELLVEQGADPTIENNDGQTPYELAASFLANPERLAVMRFLEPERHPVAEPEPSPSTRVLGVQFSGLYRRDTKRCLDLILLNESDKVVKELYGGITAQRAATGAYLNSWGFSHGIANLQPGDGLEADWCFEEGRAIELLSLVESDPATVEFIYDANRVVYGDGTEDVFREL